LLAVVVVLAAALSSSSDLERIRLMVEKTWDRCKNWWSEGRNLMPQHVMAIWGEKRFPLNFENSNF
jgi:hypothetical protein